VCNEMYVVKVWAIDVSIRIAGAIPHQVILLTGAIFSLLGAFLIFIPIVMKHKENKAPRPRGSL